LVRHCPTTEKEASPLDLDQEIKLWKERMVQMKKEDEKQE
jgi:hypothetical protein